MPLPTLPLPTQQPTSQQFRAPQEMPLVAAVDEVEVGVEVVFLRLPHEVADISTYPNFNQKQGSLIF